MGYYRFENLETWKLARGFVKIIYTIVKDFPEDEKFGLSSQMRRAALSVLLNITEGSDRKSDKEFVRFLRISYSSMQEVVAGCYVALDQSYMSKERFNYLYDKSQTLAKKINSLIKYLDK